MTAQQTGSANLAKKLSDILSIVGYIPKNGTNQGQGYKYAMAADVFNVIREHLADRNVATIVNVSKIEHTPFTTSKGSPMFLATVWGTLSFIDGETGEILTTDFVGTGSDSTDKAAYKAITGGLKYALLTSFLIPTGDDPENDSNQQRGGDRVVSSVPASAPRTPQVARTVESGSAVPPVQSVTKQGITDAQRRKLMAWYRSQDISTTAPNNQAHVLQLAITGKNSVKDMDQRDYDKLVDVMENPDKYAEQIRFAKQEVVTAA